MTVFTKPAAEVFAPTTAGGAPRGADLGEAAVWGTEVEAAINAAISGIRWALSVDLATTANITLSGEQTIDGTLTSTSRVLVKNQTSAAANGIYVTGAGAWTRATDANTADELIRIGVGVKAGTANAGKLFVCTNTSITLGTTTLTFVDLGPAIDIAVAAADITDSTTVGRAILTAANAAAVKAAIGAFVTADYADDSVTLGKMQDISTNRLLGRYSASTGTIQEVIVGNGVELVEGTGALRRSELTGDVTATAGSSVLTIPNDTVTNAKAANMAEGTVKMRRAGAGSGDPTDATLADLASDMGAVLTSGAQTVAGVKTFSAPPVVPNNSFALSKLVDIAANRLLGSEAGGTVAPIIVGNGIEFNGAGALRRSAFTGGDVTAAAGSAALTIAAKAVTNAKLDDMAAGTVKMRRSAFGDGSPADTTLDLLKFDMALDNVDNTSDVAKPISTAVQAALDDKVPISGRMPRPGDSPLAYTSFLTGGDPLTIASLFAGDTQSGDDGQVVRLTGPGIVAERALTALEPSRLYQARAVVRRRVNTPDPANDSVRIAIAWYDQNKIRLAGGSAQTVIQDINDLTVASGRRQVIETFSRSAGVGAANVAPSTARYARVYVQAFGSTTAATDVEVLATIDTSDLTAWSPDVTAFDGRLVALEGLDAGDRLNALETAVGTPKFQIYSTRADAEAATVPPSVDEIGLLNYSAVGDAGGGYYSRAGSVPSHDLKLQSFDGAWWELSERMVHVNMAGADRSGVAGSAAAFQRCAGFIKAKMASAPAGDIGIAPIGISWTNGIYKIEFSIDLQGIDRYAWTLDGTGGVIHLTCAGKTGFDLLGSRWSTWRNVTILGDDTLSPAIGIQIGRLTSLTDPGDCHSFYNLQMSGTFTRCCVYDLASETSLWVQPALYNEDATGNAYCYIMDGYNYWGAITDFTAPSIAANTNMSCIQHTFVSCDFRNRGSGNAFWVTRSDQLKFYNGYMVSQDANAAVFFDNGSGFADIDFDVHCEQHTVAPGLQHNIYFDRISAGETYVRGFKFNEEWSASAVSPIGVSATIVTLRLINADIAVPVVGQAPSTGNLFNDTAVVVTGNIYLPTSGLQTGNISLNGGLYGPAIASVVMPRGSVTLHDQGQRTHYKGGRLFWGDEANPSVAGDYATAKNVYIQDGILYVRGDASNVSRIRFTSGPANTTTLIDIAPVHATGNLNVQVGTVVFGLRADGTLALPSLGEDPVTATNGSVWNVGGVLRKRTGGVNSNVG